MGKDASDNVGGGRCFETGSSHAAGVCKGHSPDLCLGSGEVDVLEESMDESPTRETADLFLVLIMKLLALQPIV